MAPVIVGKAGDFALGSVTTFREDRFHLVRLPDGDFLALYMVDPHEQAIAGRGTATSTCLVPWRADFEFMGRKGWFRNPCHGETYDLTGLCFSGPCPRSLDRFPVRIEGGTVQVNVGELVPGPDFEAEPVNQPER